jgi:hypothetical protein
MILAQVFLFGNPWLKPGEKPAWFTTIKMAWFAVGFQSVNLV